MYNKRFIEWDSWAQRYDMDLKDWLNINDDYLLKNFDFINKKVLDIGAASGRFDKKIAGFAKFITILDPSKEMIIQAKKNLDSFKNINFVNQPLEEFNNKEKFDFILVAEVIHHLIDKNIIKKLGEFLNNKGRIIVIEPIYTRPIIFFKKIFIKNFKDYGFRKGIKMSKILFNYRIMLHLIKEDYLSKKELKDLFDDKILKEDIINDNFYILTIKK
jgi:2-polyprenyl-3-methyl-5-hydroxy-6-metoxy-1,4-benzoquinol methylase